MICPKCGESNADNFRFCGMCGAVLEAGKTPAVPRAPAPKAEAGSGGEVPLALRIAANPARGPARGERQITTAGPSLLGLGDSGPSLDTLREKTFSGTTPTFMYEEAKTGRGRTLLLTVILAILAVGVWARYHYLGYGGGIAKPQATVAPAGSGTTPVGTSRGISSEPTPTPQQSSDTSQTAPAQAAPLENAAPPPKAESTTRTNDAAKAQQSTAKEPAPKAQVAEATAPPRPAAKVKPASAPSAGNAKAVADDSGSAAFRKGESYLYGRGVAENCDEAIRNLKSASNSGSAKARSAFGTMYATGHCVPRDLPTSYGWFARALQADPNNQILEKDLTAVWNQMTPPERQLATKMKQ